MRRSFLLLLVIVPFLTGGFTAYADKSVKATGVPSVNEFHKDYHNMGGTVTVS